MHLLTKGGDYEVRFDMEDHEGNTAYAQYSNFMVAGSDDNYTLTISGYTGDAGDAMTYSIGKQFSTRDRDNDGSSSKHCGQEYGAMWAGNCMNANINGVYGTNASNGNWWWQWKRYN